MGIPLQTTTISILRPDENASAYDDSYDGAVTPALVATKIPAHISRPSGREQIIAGEQEILSPKLICDPCDLRHTDVVLDESTNLQYLVLWTQPRQGFDLDHVEAGLRMVVGSSVG